MEKPERKKVIAAYKEFVEKEIGEKIPDKKIVYTDQKIHITSLTDKINEQSSEDILDIFLNNPKLYQKILNSEKYFIDYPVQSFLSTYETKKTNSVKKRRDYLNQFNIYKKSISSVAKSYEFICGLINATQKEEIHWKKGKNIKGSLLTHQTFLTHYNGNSVIFSIIARKREEDEKWHISISLETDGISNNVPKNNSIYNSLYKVILLDLRQQENERIKQENKLDKKIVTPQHFVVRTNIFKCFSYKHTLKEVLAIFQVMKADGSMVEEKATAAYCVDCDCFFLMISEYERIAKKGILQCQMIEKEQFYKNGLHAIDMAGESVLMRNGYNVKASVGLTDIQRQNILANIIDNNILTASQILSYLRLFRSQKVGMGDYKAAVNKWETDMEFVRLYKENSKERIYINSITRTKYKKLKE